LILEQSFAPINKLNKSNSIVYEGNNNFRFAMEQAIALKPDQYESLQKAVAETAKSIYAESLSNLKSLI
jgi:O-acetylhomoserine/O-acetylserine sulfhydrylase-like pyridoxal-dependent enzyme